MTEPRTPDSATEKPTPATEATPRDALAKLNARTAKRQQLLLAGIGAVLLAGVSWIVISPDHGKKAKQETDAQTIETAGLVNRDLSQREFNSIYGNRLDNLVRDQKELKEKAATRADVEAQLATLKAENQAMRTDGQTAIDAISNENTRLKNQLASQTQTPSPAPASTMPAYGPRAGGYDARGHAPIGSASTSGAAGPGYAAQIDGAPPPSEVKLMSFAGDKAAPGGVKLARADVPPLVVEDSPDYLPPNSYAPARVIVGCPPSAPMAQI